VGNVAQVGLDHLENGIVGEQRVHRCQHRIYSHTQSQHALAQVQRVITVT
jgi:hypothetical protein